MNNENLEKIYVIETKTVSRFSEARVMKKKGGQKMEVTCIKLLKTNGEKMSVFRLSTMLMKTNELNLSFHDVNENKGDSIQARDREKPMLDAYCTWTRRILTTKFRAANANCVIPKLELDMPWRRP